jgi:hypothetical protein
MSCTLESRQAAVLDTVADIFKSKTADLALEQVGPYSFIATPNKSNTPRNLLTRVAKAQKDVSDVLEKNPEFGAKFAFGWVTRNSDNPRKIKIGLKVPDNYTKLLEVKLGSKSLADVNKALAHERNYNYFRDRGLFEQEQRENTIDDKFDQEEEEELELVTDQETGLPDWNYDATNDVSVRINDEDLNELMKSKNC